MIDLKRQLSKIEQQKKEYKILLNRSKYRSQLENNLWENAAELASRFDIGADVTFKMQQEQNRQGLVTAFQTIKKAPKENLDVSLIKDVHAQALALSNPEQGGYYRMVPARWVNSVMVVANWSKIPYLMDNLVNGINQQHVPAFYWEECPNPQFQRVAHNPIIQAIEANYNTVAIHPFSDANKRAARLVSAWVLDKYGHIPLSVYDREDYISGIENYYSTRHPHAFHDVMLDQMQKSYDYAIGTAKNMETCRVNMGQNLWRKHNAKSM